MKESEMFEAVDIPSGCRRRNASFRLIAKLGCSWIFLIFDQGNYQITLK